MRNLYKPIAMEKHWQQPEENSEEEMPLQEGLAREQQCFHFSLADVTSIINVAARKDRFPNPNC
jgi:hypothetical protein